MDKKSHTNRNGFWDQVRPRVVRQPRAQRGAAGCGLRRAAQAGGRLHLFVVTEKPLYCLLLTDAPLGL